MIETIMASVGVRNLLRAESGIGSKQDSLRQVMLVGFRERDYFRRWMWILMQGEQKVWVHGSWIVVVGERGLRQMGQVLYMNVDDNEDY